MNKDTVAGKVKQAKGTLQDAAGDLTGSTSENIKGKANKAAGKVQEAYGNAKHTLRKEMDKQDQPI